MSLHVRVEHLRSAAVGVLGLLCLAISCTPSGTDFLGLPIETRLSFLNLSKTHYAMLGMREHTADPSRPFHYTALLAPGATVRHDFLAFIGARCPASVDLQILLYRRTHPDVPIGLDTDEAVEPTPVVAAQFDDVPACSVETLETYTIANWDAPNGTARVKIAQCSMIDEAIRSSGLLGNPEGVWEVSGVSPALAALTPADLLPDSPITGRVVLAGGSGIDRIGVLVRSRWRVRLDCNDPGRPQDAGYSDPIDFTVTDADGAFRLNRPPGAYMLEFFADDFAFRPAVMEVETPLSEIQVLAEPL